MEQKEPEAVLLWLPTGNVARSKSGFNVEVQIARLLRVTIKRVGNLNNVHGEKTCFCEAAVEYKGQRGPEIKQNCHKSNRHIN